MPAGSSTATIRLTLGLDRLTSFFGAIDALFAVDDGDILDKRFHCFPGRHSLLFYLGKASLVDFTTTRGVTQEETRSENDGAARKRRLAAGMVGISKSYVSSQESIR